MRPERPVQQHLPPLFTVVYTSYLSHITDFRVLTQVVLRDLFHNTYLLSLQ